MCGCVGVYSECGSVFVSAGMWYAMCAYWFLLPPRTHPASSPAHPSASAALSSKLARGVLLLPPGGGIPSPEKAVTTLSNQPQSGLAVESATGAFLQVQEGTGPSPQTSMLSKWPGPELGWGRGLDRTGQRGYAGCCGMGMGDCPSLTPTPASF